MAGYLAEDWGESSSPPRAAGVDGDGLRRRIYEHLLLLEASNSRHGECPPPDASSFREMLDTHFDRLPLSYLVDSSKAAGEDVLLHRSILHQCASTGYPVFSARFLQCFTIQTDYGYEGTDTESDLCQKLSEDLTLESKHDADDMCTTSASSRTSEPNFLHEIIFSSVNRPKLLSWLITLLSDVGLNIHEAHVYSTTDGFCLDIFVVDGWMTEETDELIRMFNDVTTRKFGSPHKIRELQQQVGDSEIDWSMLTKGERIASGTSADLYRGTFSGCDVAIKMLKCTEDLNNPSGVELLQEALILRIVNHENIIKYYGACTNHPNYCIVTEYMPEGNLYEFLHKQKHLLDLREILRIAISISKGMEYLHRNNIIHRDLKTANVLKGYGQALKIEGFNVAILGSQEDQMTAETGTYRWMAPEVINHKPYDHKADVFSFAIVLWELVTLKVPYDKMTPLQAALGVRQGFRLEIPPRVHPGLSKLIQQCWDEDPNARPVFGEIIIQLEDILQQVQGRPSTI
ncbi:serine/threonine-protein kinase STY17 isoform X2 [Brachypodium distachyon]|uniref:serine/threonine-protein kinase STY17 isoform X2 n=1 Tax=Brachypodium distachyon TaxID=15368 RepID=UPI00071CC577|nr:serine/threonine-protein kinase STY17 isoform X2 [Brachypodium distachyon]|eukprot:XP_014756465.1 serine/threonine-protein kinase STY17 isoform X2 [Brachypodium distachyon]